VADSSFLRAWKDGAAHRKMTTRRAPASAKPPRVHTYHINQRGSGWFPHELVDDEEEDPTYEDSDAELIPRPIVQRIRRGGASRAR